MNAPSHEQNSVYTHTQYKLQARGSDIIVGKKKDNQTVYCKNKNI